MALGPITPGADIPDIRGLYAGPDLNGLEQTPAWTSTHSPLLLEHAQNTYMHPGLTGHPGRALLIASIPGGRPA